MTQTVSEWGPQGAARFDGHVGAIVIVDVLSFSTCVDIAVARGAIVYPFGYGDRRGASDLANSIGGAVAGPRGNQAFRFSLSPASLTGIEAGSKLVLPSPNGSAISAEGRATPVLAGCLRNARAVARRALDVAQDEPVAIVPAGERWPDGTLRPAIEDLIGAGAIAEALGRPCSPEAEVARRAFVALHDTIADIVRKSTSGQELVHRGYPDDVELAVALDASTTAPRLVNGTYTA